MEHVVVIPRSQHGEQEFQNKISQIAKDIGSSNATNRFRMVKLDQGGSSIVSFFTNIDNELGLLRSFLVLKAEELDKEVKSFTKLIADLKLVGYMDPLSIILKDELPSHFEEALLNHLLDLQAITQELNYHKLNYEILSEYRFRLEPNFITNHPHLEAKITPHLIDSATQRIIAGLNENIATYKRALEIQRALYLEGNEVAAQEFNRLTGLISAEESKLAIVKSNALKLSPEFKFRNLLNIKINYGTPSSLFEGVKVPEVLMTSKMSAIWQESKDLVDFFASEHGKFFLREYGYDSLEEMFDLRASYFSKVNAALITKPRAVSYQISINGRYRIVNIWTSAYRHLIETQTARLYTSLHAGKQIIQAMGQSFINNYYFGAKAIARIPQIGGIGVAEAATYFALGGVTVAGIYGLGVGTVVGVVLSQLELNKREDEIAMSFDDYETRHAKRFNFNDDTNNQYFSQPYFLSIKQGLSSQIVFLELMTFFKEKLQARNIDAEWRALWVLERALDLNGYYKFINNTLKTSPKLNAYAIFWVSLLHNSYRLVPSQSQLLMQEAFRSEILNNFSLLTDEERTSFLISRQEVGFQLRGLDVREILFLCYQHKHPVLNAALASIFRSNPEMNNHLPSITKDDGHAFYLDTLVKHGGYAYWWLVLKPRHFVEPYFTKLFDDYFTLTEDMISQLDLNYQQRLQNEPKEYLWTSIPHGKEFELKAREYNLPPLPYTSIDDDHFAQDNYPLLSAKNLDAIQKAKQRVGNEKWNDDKTFQEQFIQASLEKAYILLKMGGKSIPIPSYITEKEPSPGISYDIKKLGIIAAVLLVLGFVINSK